MAECEKIVAILTIDGGTSEGSSITTYGDNVAAEVRGARFDSEVKQYSSSPIVTTFCKDPTPEIGEIMGVTLRSKSGFSAVERGTYPNKPEWNYETKSGEVLISEPLTFWIIHTRSGPDYWLAGVEPPAQVTPIATTKPGIQDRDFRVWIGERGAIEKWMSLNSLKIDVQQKFINFSGGTTSTSVYQYQGWKLACSFPYENLLAYPFCGGVVRGQEEKGPQFINLCTTDLGLCNKPCKCDCCDIGRRVLEAFGVDY